MSRRRLVSRLPFEPEEFFLEANTCMGELDALVRRLPCRS